jgi:hypothetical protein
MKKLLLLLLSIATAALAGTAYAASVVDGTLNGRTSQGYKTRVVVKDGQVQFVRLPWRASHCTPRDGYRIKFPRWNYRNDPDGPIEQSADGRKLTDGGTLVEKSRGSRIVVHARLTGHFVGDNRIEGTQRIRLRSHDKFGRHRCSARMRWSATR